MAEDVAKRFAAVMGKLSMILTENVEIYMNVLGRR